MKDVVIMKNIDDKVFNDNFSNKISDYFTGCNSLKEIASNFKIPENCNKIPENFYVDYLNWKYKKDNEESKFTLSSLIYFILSISLPLNGLEYFYVKKYKTFFICNMFFIFFITCLTVLYMFEFKKLSIFIFCMMYVISHLYKVIKNYFFMPTKINGFYLSNGR